LIINVIQIIVIRTIGDVGLLLEHEESQLQNTSSHSNAIYWLAPPLYADPISSDHVVASDNSSSSTKAKRDEKRKKVMLSSGRMIDTLPNAVPHFIGQHNGRYVPLSAKLFSTHFGVTGVYAQLHFYEF
jgi:hypothetical protein